MCFPTDFQTTILQKLIVNIDGLEHKRAKWGKFTKWFLRVSEAMAVRFADAIVADNKGIQDYVMETYGKKSELIAYGGDHTQRKVSEERQQEILNKYGVKPNDYSISVCRIEPENNSHILCDAFAKSGKNLVFIGNWNCSDYSRNLKNNIVHTGIFIWLIQFMTLMNCMLCAINVNVIFMDIVPEVQTRHLLKPCHLVNR